MASTMRTVVNMREEYPADASGNPDIGPERDTYAEAVADAHIDMLLWGSIYVVRNHRGKYQRIKPTNVRVIVPPSNA